MKKAKKKKLIIHIAIGNENLLLSRLTCTFHFPQIPLSASRRSQWIKNFKINFRGSSVVSDSNNLPYTYKYPLFSFLHTVLRTLSFSVPVWSSAMPLSAVRRRAVHAVRAYLHRDWDERISSFNEIPAVALRVLRMVRYFFFFFSIEFLPIFSDCFSRFLKQRNCYDDFNYSVCKL